MESESRAKEQLAEAERAMLEKLEKFKKQAQNLDGEAKEKKEKQIAALEVELVTTHEVQDAVTLKRADERYTFYF